MISYGLRRIKYRNIIQHKTLMILLTCLRITKVRIIETNQNEFNGQRMQPLPIDRTK